MPNRPFTSGITLPSLWQWLVAGAVVCGSWLLWKEVRERRATPDAAATPGSFGEELRRVEELAERGAASIPALTKELSDPVPRTRRNALFALSLIGPDATAVLGKVRERLADGDPTVRKYAVAAFRRISRDPNDTVATVAPLLADGDPGVRLDAARALVAIGPDATRPLIRELQNDSFDVRVGAVRALRAIHAGAPEAETVEAIRGQLDQLDRTTRIHALAALAGWKLARLSEIRELLHFERVGTEPDTSLDPIEIALEAVTDLGPAAENLLPDVVALFDDEQFLAEAGEKSTPPQTASQSAGHPPQPRRFPSFFYRVLGALRSMKEAGGPALPDLRRHVPKAEGYRRLTVARTMVAIGAQPVDVTPVLAPLLTGPPQDDPFEAGELLMQISPEEARRQVALLLPRITNDDGSVNSAVLRGIHSLAPEAGEAVPALINVLRKQDPQVVRTTVNALGRIGPAAEPAVPELIALLGAGGLDDRFWSEVVRALGRIGPAAKDAVPAILAVINSRNRAPAPQMTGRSESIPSISTRTEAIGVLAELGQATPDVLRTLRVQLASEPWQVRGVAVKSLARLAGDSPGVLDELLPLLNDDYADVRAHAALAIGNINVDRRAVVPRLIESLADESPFVSTAAAMALKKIGPDAKAALPALREALDDETNSLPNQRRAQVTSPSRMPTMSMELLWELNKISIAQAARDAIAAIEFDNR